MTQAAKEKQVAEQVSIKIPRYSPGNPPENYSKKKTIGIFCCLWFSAGFRCPELLRATIAKQGDIYVIPFTEYGIGDFHLSYHKSGKFHWGQDGTHVQPACGEADFAAAFGLWLRMNQPPCLCFRKRKGLTYGEISSILQHLAQNFPFTFDIKEASRSLEDTNCYRLVSPELQKKRFFHDLRRGRLRRCLKRLQHIRFKGKK